MSADRAPAPDWVEDLFQQASNARKAGRHALALAIYQRVVSARPEHRIALQHLGALLTILGRRAEAEAALRRALALEARDPYVRHALAMTLMALGRYGEAGPLYEARFEVAQLGLRKPAGVPFPEWRGEDLSGRRLLIVSEMGFGDQIQHARFAALLRDRGAEVLLLCRPQLTRLFAQSFPGVQVAPAGEPIDFPGDYWAMGSSLMSRLAPTPDAVPSAPYLRAPEPFARCPGGFRIGLMTAGDPTHANDGRRSLPAEEARRLRADLPGELVELAPETTGAQDFAETAALIASLDLVVSVDTAVAHLAGALGRRALVLIPAVNTDWRWMDVRTDSPWYPSLRLYRADPQAGWGAALQRLAADARALASSSDPGE